jgi:hypothetical protein
VIETLHERCAFVLGLQIGMMGLGSIHLPILAASETTGSDVEPLAIAGADPDGRLDLGGDPVGAFQTDFRRRLTRRQTGASITPSPRDRRATAR